jgi:hypothetical protein
MVSAPGCGARRLAEGSVPFPAGKPVLVDGSGAERADLPPAAEPARIVVLDFPWCPACADAWEALRAAAGTLPPGTLHVYRILFDRERLLTAEGAAEVPPLSPTPPLAPPLADSAGSPVPVTALTAIPRGFLDEFRVTRAPVLLLLDEKGAVTRRWVGHSPSLGGAIADEVRRTQGAPPSPGR